MDIQWDLVARLLVAAGLGAVVGLEREASGQPAGLRTHLAVALGASLFGVISTTGFLEYQATRDSTNIQIDVTRVASLVASGIGFIGAGLIFRHGTSVKNLTTAASLWVAAAIGLSCGVGDFAPAVATTVVMLLALVLLRFPRNWVRMHTHPEAREIEVVLRAGESEHAVVAALQGINGIRLDSYSLEKADGAFVVIAQIHALQEAVQVPELRAALSPIARLEGVSTMRVNPPTD